MDERLRELQRRAATGEISEKAAYLHAMVHAGIFTTEEIKAMAYLGVAAAQRLLPTPPARLTEKENNRPYAVDAFRVNDTPSELETQVIVRLSRHRAFQLGFHLFETLLLPQARALEEALGYGLSVALTAYLNHAKAYVGLQEGPKLLKFQFEGLRRAIQHGLERATQRQLNSGVDPGIVIPATRIAEEIVTALHLDQKVYTQRRIFWLIGDALVNVNYQSQFRFAATDQALYRRLYGEVYDFLVPPEVR